jgi:hypothetical protein
MTVVSLSLHKFVHHIVSTDSKKTYEFGVASSGVIFIPNIFKIWLFDWKFENWGYT